VGEEGGREEGRKGGREEGRKEGNGIVRIVAFTFIHLLPSSMQAQIRTHKLQDRIIQMNASRTYITGFFEQMKELLFLSRLPNNGGVRRHFPYIRQVFKLQIIGRVGDDKGVPTDLR